MKFVRHFSLSVAVESHILSVRVLIFTGDNVSFYVRMLVNDGKGNSEQI